MFLTDEEVIQFQAIYRQQFSREISQEDARERGIKLVRLFEIIHKTMTIDEYNEVQKKAKRFKT